MSRLTRDGTAEPVSRDQIIRHSRGQGNTIFPVQLTTSRISNLTRLIHTLLLCDNRTYIYIHIRVTTKPLGYELQHLLYRVLRVFQDMTQSSCHRPSTNRLSRVDSQFLLCLEGGIWVTCHITRNIQFYQKRCTILQVLRPNLASLRKCGSEVNFWFSYRAHIVFTFTRCIWKRPHGYERHPNTTFIKQL